MGSPFYPIDGSWESIVSCVLVFISAVAATTAGVGGGALYTPVFVLLLGVGHESIPLAKAAVFGAAVAMFACNAFKKHPSGIGPLISYDVALMLEPATLVGTMVGVRLNKMLPFWSIGIMLVSILLVIGFKTLRKAIAAYRTEKKLPPAGAERDPLERAPLLGSSTSSFSLPRGVRVYPSAAPPVTTSVVAVPGATYPQFPVLILLALIFCWGYVLFVSLWLGGRAGDAVIPWHMHLPDIHCGSALYWVILTSTVPVLSIVTFFACRAKLGHPIHRVLPVESPAPQRISGGSDVPSRSRLGGSKEVWTVRLQAKYVLISLVAGIASGLTGLGGSTIKGPLLLRVLEEPRVSSATCAFMLLTTVSATVVQFGAVGMIDAAPAALLFGIALVAAFIGQALIHLVVRRTRRTSPIVFALAIYMFVALFAMGGVEIVRTVAAIKEHRADLLGVRGLCDANSTRLEW